MTKKIIFWNIETNGIPVDLFKINRTATLPTQKRLLRSVLTAGVGALSVAQKNGLSSVLSDTLALIDPNEPIRTGDILAMLQEDNSTFESLRCRLEPLFEDIDELGMSQQSWGDVVNQSQSKIFIFQTAFIGAEHGNQLIDMILASLFSFQQENHEVPLDIFIDEVQNQNFSPDSPIARILKEGRKFNCAFFGATQDFYPFKTELGKVMSKADTNIFQRPTPNSANAVADVLRFKKADLARFDGLQRGDATT